MRAASHKVSRTIGSYGHGIDDSDLIYFTPYDLSEDAVDGAS